MGEIERGRGGAVRHGARTHKPLSPFRDPRMSLSVSPKFPERFLLVNTDAIAVLKIETNSLPASPLSSYEKSGTVLGLHSHRSTLAPFLAPFAFLMLGSRSRLALAACSRPSLSASAYTTHHHPQPIRRAEQRSRPVPFPLLASPGSRRCLGIRALVETAVAAARRSISGPSDVVHKPVPDHIGMLVVADSVLVLPPPCFSA